MEKWTAAEVKKALVANYLDGLTTANFFEFELPADDSDEAGYYRRADLLTIFCGGVNERSPFIRQRETTKISRHWFKNLPCGWRAAFEIKVSRADFRVDAQQQWKHTPIQRCSNEMFFVYPRGLISITEARDYHNKDEKLLPISAGAIEVYRDERTRWRGSLRAQIVRAPLVSLLVETPLAFVDQIVRRSLYGRATSGLAALKSSNSIFSMHHHQPPRPDGAPESSESQ